MAASERPPSSQAHLLQVYETYVQRVIEPAYWDLLGLLATWQRSEFWESAGTPEDPFSPTPVQAATARIKRPESILDKLTRRAADFPEGLSIASLHRMPDILGGRIVVHFTSDLALVDYAIRNSETLEVSREDPPEAYLSHETLKRLGLKFKRVAKKNSGYTSLHYVVRFRALHGRDQPWFELQVRTLAQDAWAAIEHILGYKSGVRAPFYVRRQLALLAKYRDAFDDEFELVRDELDVVASRDGAVSEDEDLSAAVLPALLAEHGLRVPRGFASTELKMLVSRGVDTAGRFRRLMALDWVRSLIDETYDEELDRKPRDVETVSSLANVAELLDFPECFTPKEVKVRIQAQIAFDSRWAKLLESTVAHK